MTGATPGGGGLRAPVPRAQVDEAALLLSLSARPVIWAGAGAIAAGAGEAVAAIAGLLAAPVVTSVSGKGLLGEDGPMIVGSLFGAPEVARLLGGADAGLAVGTTFSGRSTRNGSLPLPMQLIQVDLDPAVFGRAYPVRLGIPGDARAVLEALADRLSAHAVGGAGAARDQPAEAAKVAELRAAAKLRLAAASGGVAGVLDALRRAIPPAVTTVWDGQCARWAAPLFPVAEPGTFRTPAREAPAGSALATARALAEAGPAVAVVSPAELESGQGGAGRAAVVVWDGGTVSEGALARLGDALGDALGDVLDGNGPGVIRLGAA
ncbi:MAG TPA: hypothetical protein VHA57_05460 [Actinomycetota bacterium]|nr:hypothetical protein [Actinomycetota bacterium]